MRRLRSFLRLGAAWLWWIPTTVGLAATGCGGPSAPPSQPLEHPAPAPPHHPAPARAPDPPPARLDQLADCGAKFLAEALASLPEVRGSDRKMVLALGPIQNQTRAPTQVFDSALRRLQAKLNDDEAVRSNFLIASTTYADARDLLRDVAPEGHTFDDPLAGDRPAVVEPLKYHPASIYVIVGRFFEETSTGHVSYRLLVEVNHPYSRRQVASQSFHVDLAWDPMRGRWYDEAP